ncbi:bifunctional helix-turn-helix transcriptional regulator/GNAT family N-acetyltransferase [Roseococcus pinisoli]|uniref:MarR family transcriptional regulator n=1 Tax=Roseococcus pinisoli TaxID=2835040 RepID=A0ABS5Q8G8_9PROT|nr:helix-turn-helix domain-containing GNAT family N-acetyltransferase [Roseococcus pinisoli]MBS7809769.1 MarR family transcriptional regulator [Roseococcus pinisoli]
MTDISQSEVAALRAFNRLYTRRLGLLNARLDGSPFTLTEARILYELAQRTAPAAADILRALDLDSGQLSRTLKRFAERGLLESDADPEGGRRRPLSLTRAGRATFAALERNTNEAVGTLLRTLPEGRRRRLLSAVDSITKVFEDSSMPEATLRDLKPGDLGWIAHRQAVLYAEEYGWNGEFDAMAARILADFVQSFDSGHDAAWIAEIDGRVAGSVFLVRGETPGTGKLRLLYVEPEARGTGLGAKLVDACIARARQVGDRSLMLWTNDILAAARRIYQRAGFSLVEEAPHHSFGKDLMGQIWELRLDGAAPAGKAA